MNTDPGASIPPPGPSRVVEVSSRAFNTSKFSCHGEMVLRATGNVVHYTSTGPFNLEGMAAVGTARSVVLQQWKPVGPYAAIVLWQHSMLMSAEALQVYEAGFTKLTGTLDDLCALAWVVDESVEGVTFMLPRFVRIFEEVGINFRRFTAIAPAEEWVAQCITHKSP